MGSSNHLQPYVLQAAMNWNPAAKLRIEKIDNPDAKKTLGDIELAVNIQGPAEFPMTFLIEPFDPKRLVGIDSYSLRVFHKDKKSDSLQLVWNSGVNIGMGFAWAKIRRPGMYVVLGLPSDRLLRETLRALAELHRYGHAFTQDEIKEEVCNFRIYIAHNVISLSSLAFRTISIAGKSASISALRQCCGFWKSPESIFCVICYCFL